MAKTWRRRPAKTRLRRVDEQATTNVQNLQQQQQQCIKWEHEIK
jgi:hypothetical protein